MQKRGDKWRVQFYDEFGTKKSATFDRKEDAKNFLAKVQRDRQLVKAGLEKPRESTLILDYTKRWLQKRLKTKAHGTVDKDASRLTNHFLETFGMRPLDTITSKELRDHLDAVQEKHQWSNGTRNRMRAVLSKMFNDAFMDELVSINPVKRVPLLKEKPFRLNILSDDEIHALLNAAEQSGDWSERDKLFLNLALFQGPRISEIVAFQVQDFDLKSGTLHIRRIYETTSREIRERRKSDAKGIEVPLFERVRNAFLACKSKYRYPSDKSFLFRSDAGEFTTDNGRKLLKQLAKRAGIKRHITPHVLRATCATTMKEAGFSKEDIQEFLGHALIATTEKYVRTRVDKLKSKAQSIDFGRLEESSQVIILRPKDVTGSG